MRRSAPLRWAPLALLSALSACGGGGGRPVVSTAGRGNYAAPGPPGDPWGPYIHQAAARFSVPEAWPRAVMHQESGGREYMRGQPITSDAGAMGLMQVMPATYAELAARYGLGSDPYEPHDNIMAGTGYIKELYEKYGSPAFLAAYNAGPRRLETYLAGNGNLPNETVNYLASTAPNLGQEIAMTGPLASFGAGGGVAAPVLHDFVRSPAGCWQDPNAAYDPDAACRTAPPVRLARVEAPVRAYRAAAVVRVAAAADCWRDPDAAYDPGAPCRARPAAVVVASGVPAPVPFGQVAMASAAPVVRPVAVQRAGCWHDPDAAYDPGAPCQVAPVRVAPVEVAQAGPAAAGWGRGQPEVARGGYRFPGNLLISPASAATIRPVMASGRWAIQVGAYGSPGEARRAAESVRTLAPRELGGTRAVLGTTAPFGGQVMYRARLLGLSAVSASSACSALQARAQACVTVPPGG